MPYIGGLIPYPSPTISTESIEELDRRADALLDPNRLITVNVSVIQDLKSPYAVEARRFYALKVTQGTALGEVVARIQRQLPEDMPHPYTVNFAGSNPKNPRHLSTKDTGKVSDILPLSAFSIRSPETAPAYISLRVMIQLPEDPPGYKRNERRLTGKLRELWDRFRSQADPSTTQSQQDPGQASNQSLHPMQRDNEAGESEAPPSYGVATNRVSQSNPD